MRKISSLSTKFMALLLGSAALLGCEAKPQEPEVIVTFGDHDEWEQWKREQEEEAKREGFIPVPITVSGVGKARGKPDIAVLTGVIKTTADFDYLAVDDASQVMNNVQDAVRGAKVDLSFTQVSTAEIRDPKCLEANRYARQRHRDIINDNNFNMWLKRQPKENKQKPRKPKERIAEQTCPVTHVEGFVRFTAWVQPVDEAGDYINIFTNAGVDEVDLFGYDFSNYDELYKAAARDAVLNAKAKAELAAKTAGTRLTTLERFYVSPTQRTTRYGQQAMIISNHGNRRVAQRRNTSAQDQVIVTGSRFSKSGFQSGAAPMPAPPAAMMTCWDGSITSDIGQCPGQPVTASTSQFTVFNGVNATVVESDSTVVSNTGEILARVQIPKSGGNSVPKNNALRMTLMSGSQTITVNAQMAFSYETPLNGKVIIYDNN